MSKNHDESKDLRLVGRIVKIDYSNKTIQAPKTVTIGIRTWGRIDYLVNYCGWYFIWNNEVKLQAKTSNAEDNTNTKRKREAKKLAKENTLTNKKKKR